MLDKNVLIRRCLEKNPDNRPFMAEIIEHPFLAELPENDYLLTQEIKALAMDVLEKGKAGRQPEAIVRKNLLKTHQTNPPEAMFTEDLAALEVLTEDAILDELQERLQQGHFHTFVGDVLLILNPNEDYDIYGAQDHTKYQCKSRSDNAPHVYSIADSAYQDVLHNEEPQHILFAGESNSGKTTNMLHAIEHLMFLGKSLQDTGARLMKALKVIHVFSNAATPLNPNSTRCVLQTQTTYGSSGKASGAIFWLYQLEKWRVSTRDKNQSNFHIFYYFYDGLEAAGKLRQYNLPSGRRMRYLRIGEKGNERKRSFKVRNDPDGNVTRFGVMKENLKIMEMEEYFDTMWKILAAILLLGEIRFVEDSNGEAEMDSNETANKVAELLGLDQKKFSWALINYCLIRKGAAIRKKHTCEEAREARDVLANTIYQRFVDWLINMMNLKFTVTRTLFGDKYSISVLDLFGFECFAVNRIEQLFVNTTNEQMQCHYNQRIFAWEMQEQEEEDIKVQKFHFYDNKDAIDRLMGKDNGLFHIIDEASRQLQDVQYIFEKIKQEIQGTHIKQISSHEFTIAHYTGKLVYDASEISEKNRDFVPPEMIETLRQSSFDIVKDMFTNKLTKAGNLTIVVDNQKTEEEKKIPKSKWGAIIQENMKLRKYNTASKGQYSQTRKMRTCAATFRSTSLEILKSLLVGGGSGGIHFVRCIRADLEGIPQGFYRDVVRQQIRALAVLDTAKARQRGYPYRITFQEFLRRYKFLAFDFDENVEITKDNCRLLLVRLKMEGWIIGKTKVFLKYYNEEYLSRLYETQVKKIVKVQCMMRAFLARKNIASKVINLKKQVVKKASIRKKEPSIDMTQEEAALMIQKAYRGHIVRKEMAPLLKGDMEQETKDFIKFYSSKWRSKSIFQVLLRYRAARYQDLVQFSQQVHLFNQAIAGTLEATNERVPLDKIDPGIKASTYLGQMKPPQVHKLPFDIYHDMPYFDTSYMNNPTGKKKSAGSMSTSVSDDEHEPWDAPLRRQTVPWPNSNVRTRDVEVQTTNSPHRVAQQDPSGSEGQSLINTPFSRDPNVPVRCPPEDSNRAKADNVGSQLPAIDHSPARSSNAHNPHSNNYENTGSIRSKKNAPPPPIPPFGQVSPVPPSRSYDVHNLEARARNNFDSGNDWEFDDKVNRNTSAVASNRVNPIHELQMLGRKHSNDDGEDQPPFNFQAMLRKTPHQRASMKRTAVYDSYAPSPSPYGRPISREEHYESNVVYRSGGSRRDSSEWSPNEMIRMSEKYGREGAWSAGGDRNDAGDVSESVTTELAPGIVVEGYVSEL
ncbi:neither inactivation nor afterpotential protein C-like isoform X5 [Vespa mandarinia]|uniref:neither inactivation nor afterpotential protein C-like isoform X5 n=1 Tax=Vespa mandarinia TaxID=7446 RepID=UPI00160BA3F5|nr:neither inactivation nor afterpotential protein C-like isoform X5 [Vespa mandarinia]